MNSSSLTTVEFLRAVEEHGVAAREALLRRGHDEDAIERKAEKAHDRGYTDAGARPWLTDKGRLFLQSPCNFADAEELGAEATADYCYAHQSFGCPIPKDRV